MREHAVVTGGAGFVGSHVCDRLLAAGADVTCVDNFSTGDAGNIAHLKTEPRFRFVEADVSRGFDVPGPVDLVMHLASPASPRDYERLPVETLQTGAAGTNHALDLAQAHGARFVLTSTSEVYGDPRQHPQRETYWGNVNPVGPRSVYDEAKRYAEALTTAYRRARGVNTGIARLFNTYGPRMRADDGRAIPTFIRQILTGEPVTVAGAGTQTRSLCFVDDTVAGLLALAESDFPGPVNLGNPRELEIRELVDEIQRLAGTSVPVRHIPAPVDDPQRRCPDIGLAQRELGWQPRVELHDGLRRTLEWFATRLSPV
ncbi:UDP-glucuronic acid decarboxylase family protein [Amycolatopsis thermophila]|uniref:dTDP-glucose 4,6-dehydratase n=1 Tax=Amycolatopsis thermophila TaxID=206084 RepID=A0ABU0F3W9_9PSEU|nr:UDP-glucuronic acid decarboxylase family protein [Amycolatopsis thermophila]MDQ0382277.1 dTDP-glucose 4,6-dehydratase [Amycolatopsis thermophila]